MATTISFGIQKGGAGKTTTAGLTAYMLSQKYRVLVVDTDSQGNITELLTGSDLDVFREQTILEALQKGDVRPYIMNSEICKVGAQSTAERHFCAPTSHISLLTME